MATEVERGADCAVTEPLPCYLGVNAGIAPAEHRTGLDRWPRSGAAFLWRIPLSLRSSRQSQIVRASIYQADPFPADLRSSEACDLWIDVAVDVHGINSMETDMAIGTVKWFNGTKGYGFIQPEQGGKDVFVHISAVERAGLDSLNEGQRVQYEIARDRGKESAANLSLA
jgi:CspA family cold shock protein